MKVTITIVCFLFLSISFGQIADYFDSDQRWLQSSSCIQGTDDCLLNTNFTYYVNGDTDVVATGELYKVIRKNGLSEYVSLDTSVSGLCEGEFAVNHIAALLRQEGRKIYIFDMNDEQEYLLYDFTLTEGDTLPVTPIQPLENVIVEEVDSFNIGLYYLKKFYISLPEVPFIIEGIGSNHGLLEEMLSDSECTYSHGCYSRNGETIWSLEGTGSECDYSVGEIVEQSNNIALYPNPAREKLFVQGVNVEGSNVDIYDFSGRKVSNCLISDNNAIDISELETGNYILHLNMNGQILTQRFVKIPE